MLRQHWSFLTKTFADPGHFSLFIDKTQSEYHSSNSAPQPRLPGRFWARSEDRSSNVIRQSRLSGRFWAKSGHHSSETRLCGLCQGIFEKRHSVFLQQQTKTDYQSNQKAWSPDSQIFWGCEKIAEDPDAWTPDSQHQVPIWPRTESGSLVIWLQCF